MPPLFPAADASKALTLSDKLVAACDIARPRGEATENPGADPTKEGDRWSQRVSDLSQNGYGNRGIGV
eukprot:4099809-Heterocapsa_arctica.AAC.1